MQKKVLSLNFIYNIKNRFFYFSLAIIRLYINFFFFSVVMDNVNSNILQFTHLSKTYEIYKLYYSIYSTK